MITDTALTAAFALSAAVALAYQTSEAPVLDLEAMEPQVAEKIDNYVKAVAEAPGSHEAWGADNVRRQNPLSRLAPGRWAG